MAGAWSAMPLFSPGGDLKAGEPLMWGETEGSHSLWPARQPSAVVTFAIAARCCQACVKPRLGQFINICLGLLVSERDDISEI